MPAYSPHAVAEHTLALVLALNRRIHKAHNRVRENNFNLDGLIGFDLNEKTVGIIGTGQIGAITAGIFQGFNCRVIAYDVAPDPDCEARGIAYVDLDTLFCAIGHHLPALPAHATDAAPDRHGGDREDEARCDDRKTPRAAR